jgi:hypothetical protein
MSQANAAHSTRAPDLSLVGVNRRSTLPALIDARTGDLVAAAGLEARICHKLDKKCPGIVVHYLTLSPRSTRWRISYCASISDQLPRGSCSLPSCRSFFSRTSSAPPDNLASKSLSRSRSSAARRLERNAHAIMQTRPIPSPIQNHSCSDTMIIASLGF